MYVLELEELRHSVSVASRNLPLYLVSHQHLFASAGNIIFTFQIKLVLLIGFLLHLLILL